jgi:exonuclease III
MVTEPLARISIDCGVDMTPRGLEKPSDHTPVWATFTLPKT